MSAYLKEIKLLEDHVVMPYHRISMLFTDSMDSDELYSFITTVETQYCTKDEYNWEDGLSDELFLKKLNYAQSFIGKVFDINLYKFTVKELTKGRYKAFEFEDADDFYYDFKTITDYHIASYMTKDEVLLNLKYSICLQGIQGYMEGVLSDESTEEITAELFFPRPCPIFEKKVYEIPYDKYQNLNTEFIVNEAQIEEIQQGHYLASRIKERNIPKHYSFDTYIYQIQEYRSKVKAAEIANKSLRKKIFFWESKETVDKLILNSDFISWAIDSIILSRLYPIDCEKARKEHIAECERSLRKAFLYEDADEKHLETKKRKFQKYLKEKYKGKEILRPIN